jgi:hypothetical protein
MAGRSFHLVGRAALVLGYFAQIFPDFFGRNPPMQAPENEARLYLLQLRQRQLNAAYTVGCANFLAGLLRNSHFFAYLCVSILSGCSVAWYRASMGCWRS